MPDQNTITVGAAVARFLEACGVKAAFGVISIHNMPILDAFAQRGKTRFVMARGEAGATNMADAYARTTASLGVSITSTGTAAGNAAGAMVEALTAGTPLLHLTGQIETDYLDKDLAYIHEAPDQLSMLTAVSKAAFRVRSAETALGTVKLAVQTALTAPAGPVSVEIPIDIQEARIPVPADWSPLPVARAVPSAQALDALAERLAQARRPLLWLGGGARHASAAVARLLDLGMVGVVGVEGAVGVRPSTLDVSADGTLEDLRWLRWDARGAEGAGTLKVRDCDPSCASGGKDSYPATITLSSPMLCGRATYFDRARVELEAGAPGRVGPTTYVRAPC